MYTESINTIRRLVTVLRSWYVLVLRFPSESLSYSDHVALGVLLLARIYFCTVFPDAILNLHSVFYFLHQSLTLTVASGQFLLGRH